MSSSTIFLEWLLIINLLLIPAKFIHADKTAANTSDATIDTNIDRDNITINSYISNDITFTHYDIDLTIKSEQDYYVSKININIDIRHDVNAIVFHSANMILLNTFSSKSGNIYNSTLVQLSSDTWSLSFPEGLSRGNYTLSLEFNGTFDAGGLFKTLYRSLEFQDEMELYTSHVSANEARYVFPCLDEPISRATFNITIHHPIDYAIISNAPITEYEEWTGETLSRFYITDKIPPYLVGFVLHDILDFVIVNTEHLRYRRSLGSNVKFANTVVNSITELYTSEWNIGEIIAGDEIWDPNVNHVLIPGFQGESIQNWELILYREEDLLFNETIDTIARQIHIVRTVSRALSHQWYGNRVSPILRSHLWLNEAIASLLGAEIGDKVFPQFRLMDLLVVQMQQESLRLDTDSIMQPLVPESTSDLNSPFSFSYYVKAPAILRMLRNIITDDVFQKGIRMYLKKYHLKTASLKDFLTVMQDACLEVEIPYKELLCNLTNIMDSWVTKAHYPVLNVTRQNSLQMNISVENPSNAKFWIPLTIITEANFSLPIPTSLRDEPKWIGNIQLRPKDTYYCADAEKGKWIIINVQQIGYYRVNYENENWLRLSEYLKSEKYKDIPFLNRAQIIDDAFYFLMKGQLELNTFIKLIEYLEQETNFVVWYPMFKVLEQMSGFFPFSDSCDLKEKMWTIIDKLLKTRQIFSDNMLLTCLRHELITWSCKLGSDDCKKKANHQLILHINSSYVYWPEWRDWTFCVGLMKADYPTWKRLFDIYLNNQNKYVLKFLACSQDSEVIVEYMKSMVSRDNDDKITVSDRINSFFSIIARHARNYEVLEYMLGHFLILKPREIDTMVALIYIINNMYSKEQLVEIILFVRYKLRRKDLSIAIIHQYFEMSVPYVEILNKFRGVILNYINRLIFFTEKKVLTRLKEITRHRRNFRNIEFTAYKDN